MSKIDTKLCIKCKIFKPIVYFRLEIDINSWKIKYKNKCNECIDKVFDRNHVHSLHLFSHRLSSMGKDEAIRYLKKSASSHIPRRLNYAIIKELHNDDYMAWIYPIPLKRNKNVKIIGRYKSEGWQKEGMIV